MTPDETKTDSTECVTPAANSPNAEPIEPAERKQRERFAGIERYREEIAAHPDQAIVQIGQMNADLLEMHAFIGRYILNYYSRTNNIYNCNDEIKVTIGVVKQSAQLFKLVNLLSQQAPSRTDKSQDDPATE
jgi:hypothetical protein